MKHRWLQLFVAAVAFSVSGRCAVCRCSPVPETQYTFPHHEVGVVEEGKPVAAARGVVVNLGDDDPLGGVLVEVFDHPEVTLAKARASYTGAPRQHRVAACLTGKDGRFQFQLPPGRYEIRCSKAGGWRCTSLAVEVKRKNGAKKDLRIILSVGT